MTSGEPRSERARRRLQDRLAAIEVERAKIANSGLAPADAWMARWRLEELDEEESDIRRALGLPRASWDTGPEPKTQWMWWSLIAAIAIGIVVLAAIGG